MPKSYLKAAMVAAASLLPLASSQALGPPCDVCNVVVIGDMTAADGTSPSFPPVPGSYGCVNFEVIPVGGDVTQVQAYSITTADLDIQHELSQLQESRLRGNAVTFGFQTPVVPPGWVCPFPRATHLRIGNWQ